jgi:GDP-mannose pyrophosphatase NudK
MKNNFVKIKSTEVLSDNWYLLNKITFDYLRNDGIWETQIRESYDRGNGASVFLYNKQKQQIILIRQFRLPTYLNGNPSGQLIETCAGLLDKDDPETCIKKEFLRLLQARAPLLKTFIALLQNIPMR